MRYVLFILMSSLGLSGCGCSPAPADPAPAPATQREAAIQALEARETALGEDGSSQALQQALELRDGLDAQQREATRAASGEPAADDQP